MRTHVLLHQALFALMVECEYDSITVQDILDRANIGRSTFYTHFSGKDELLKVCLEVFRTWLFEVQRKALRDSRSSEPMFGFILPFFQHLADQRELFRQISRFPGSAAILRREFEKNITAVVRREFAMRRDRRFDNKDALEPVTAIVAGALNSLAMWWLSSRSKLSPREVDHLYRRLLLHNLSSSIPEQAAASNR